MKKSILLKHKDSLHKLSKAKLIEILEIELELRLDKNAVSATRYKPINSKINNSKRAIKKFWSDRSDLVKRARIKKHIRILKEIS